ncbi:carbohydrate kinase family protein [Maritimibacter fusiformis]|uniref:Carbohydrate kinase n=1 Tax=Maritimibacter fusiformis TaxID=2603819 RepID=A0A5D0RPX7_9RHOB|nr:carbohydrate kinase [Maritimibacter fusiformis]TYB83149.1 carbohydrate kinase [Maritimibacter fusiformis]
MILCAGEALIDMLPRETRDGEAAFAPYPGGAVFNTAVALGRLGADTGFFSGISTDLFGQRLADALTAAKVDASFARHGPRPTTLAFVTLEGGHAQYAFYDENTAGRMLTPGDLPEVPEAVDALFFGGISLAVDPCGGAYSALMLREAPRRVTMIDPNVRPGFIAEPDAYRARIDALLAVADIVKVSDEDLAWLGHDVEALLSMGARLVCLTRGAHGVQAFWPGGEVFVPAKPAEVVDTVGAGDTFNAGLLAGLDRAGLLDKQALANLTEEGIVPALELGTAAAAITVSRAGANPPWEHEL